MPNTSAKIMPALLIALTIAAAQAQPTPVADDTSGRPATSAPAGPVRTGKERLGDKWSDEQRLDNCKVPPDKRGTKPRPDTCADVVTH
jgi:hypothetical protein